jgi:hypothetical protein
VHFQAHVSQAHVFQARLFQGGNMNPRVATVTILLVAAPFVTLIGCQSGSTKSASGQKGEQMTRAPLADVLARNTPSLLKIEGVTGTGEGQESDEPVFIVFVSRDTPELRTQLPVSVEDYRVVVRVSGTVRADGH